MPRKYVLDTHACVFMLTAPRKLGAAARAAIARVEAGREEAWVPAAAVAEIVMLRELGRIGIGMPEVQRVLEGVPSLKFLALDLAQLDEFVSLASIRDPFDRLMVSAARRVGAALVSRDSAVSAAGVVETVWS